ncbi:isochorismatase family protein [Anaerocolumna sedimenticola]|uniref:Isochorismatase family protein n=1 Tax=Anaerocolumna sedimenticola TaxID=2696063 RepID=A0A6P1TI69_9FIRM|nr:cysteine hydrolase family protein [Anaerocolumna sedimenticola]QHQ60133.1 isochorismatase family protein [Anaerocolumna sedimenticola]
MKQALIIIDVQNDYFEGGKSVLWNSSDTLAKVEYILEIFRTQKYPVIHVQHINNRAGATFFLPNTNGVLIHPKLTPLENEYLVVKHTPNSFFETNLSDILKQIGTKDVVICGMMSHMCIDTTVRACKDYAINVTLIDDACTTKDLSYNGRTIPAKVVHESFMASLNGMFAKVIKGSEFKL